jgi:23S rRNA pseudouridine1911/1915/1917 synthase
MTDPTPIRTPTLIDWLIAHYPQAKRQTFKQMLVSGRLLINGRRVRSLRAPLAAEDRVEVIARRGARSDAAASPSSSAKLPFAIIYEDADVLLIDKPHGLLTSTTERERRPTAWAAVKAYLAATDPSARPGLIHRLDRDAAGLLIFSKNDAAYRSLKDQFRKHTVNRVYLAHVVGKIHPPAGRIESRLEERADGTVYSTRRRDAGQPAITDYETIATDESGAILRVTLQTGRKHQIRAHLSERNAPVRNDPMYCTAPSQGTLMLVAVELAFDHPRTGERMRFESGLGPPPKAGAC